MANPIGKRVRFCWRPCGDGPNGRDLLNFLQLAGSRTCRYWSLRHDDLCGRPSHARDWHPNGAGCGAVRCNLAVNGRTCIHVRRWSCGGTDLRHRLRALRCFYAVRFEIDEPTCIVRSYFAHGRRSSNSWLSSSKAVGRNIICKSLRAICN
jgi:hypothetical protein